MSNLSDRAVARLREVVDLPDFSNSRYRIEREIARGGMGVVYEAHDVELCRNLAVKVLSLPDISADLRDRMLAEARILASLEHPGIVPVHDVGVLPDGRVFYAMKLVRGQRLDQAMDDGTELSKLLRMFERICEAVAFAHARGVIHRDLKPENVMVGSYGEVLVMDWGVAKLLEQPEQSPAAGSTDGGQLTPTRPGLVMGTPGYMSPEQAAGRSALVDERSDVYSLGAILRDMLTSVGEDEGSRRASRVPAALRAIRDKAMQGAPDDRYQSVDELRADVGRFLAQAAVAAHRESLIERAARIIRKYRTPILLVLAYLVMRTLLIIFF